MRIHHLNCGAARPLGARLFPRRYPARMVCHVVAIEVPSGVVLIDAGLSAEELRNPGSLGMVGRALGICGDPEQAAVHQLSRLGIGPSDVRHVVMTHLDLDHAGGLADFPDATIHVAKAELDAALRPRTRGESMRYREHQWAHGPRWSPVEFPEEAEDGIPPEVALADVPIDLSLISLPGHTRGHCAVGFTAGEERHVHVGDAWYARREDEPRRSLPYRIFQSSVHVEPALAHISRQRAKVMCAEAVGAVVYSSHDTEAFQAASARSSLPAAQG